MNRPHYPLLAIAFVALWLLLTESVSVGAILIGAILGAVGSVVLASLQVPRQRLKRLRMVPRLMLEVFVEIVRSNNAVARIILGLRPRQTRVSGFVVIHLEMRSPLGLSVLACILTATPGTVWVDYSAQDGKMLLHVLDLVDEDTWVRTIKEKWERPLMDIFE